jgi:FHS family L-fucose permease-like MFS transporter
MPSIGSTFSTLAKDTDRYVFGVIAQFVNVGAMIMCWTYIYQYAEAIGVASVTAGYFQMAAFILFTIGRGFGTYLLRFVNAGKLLMYFALFAMGFILGTVFITGIVGLYSLVLVSFCLSLMFPTIYGIALGRFKRRTS